MMSSCIILRKSPFPFKEEGDLETGRRLMDKVWWTFNTVWDDWLLNFPLISKSVFSFISVSLPLCMFLFVPHSLAYPAILFEKLKYSTLQSPLIICSSDLMSQHVALNINTCNEKLIASEKVQKDVKILSSLPSDSGTSLSGKSP